MNRPTTNSQPRAISSRTIMRAQTKIMIAGIGLVTALGIVASMTLEYRSKARPKYPTIKFEKHSHDFGKVVEGEKPEYQFRFTNEGRDSLRINRVYGTCACTASLITDRVVGPDGEGRIHIILDTSKRTGFQEQSVTVLSNDINNPMIQLTVYADVQERRDNERITP